MLPSPSNSSSLGATAGGDATEGAGADPVPGWGSSESASSMASISDSKGSPNSALASGFSGATNSRSSPGTPERDKTGDVG